MPLSYTLLRNLRFCDRSIGDLLFASEPQSDGVQSRILEIAPYIRTPSLSPLTVIDASALCALPAFTDLHCHPFYTAFEHTHLEAGRLAAAAGGFDHALIVLDDAFCQTDTLFLASASMTEENPLCRFSLCFPAPKEGSDIRAFLAKAKEAGAVAISDHGAPIASASHLYQVMRACKEADLPFFADPQDASFPRGGVNTESLSQKFALPHSPAIAESAQVARVLAIAKETACRVHIQTVTTKASLDMIRLAKAQGLCVTCETSPAYFLLSQTDLRFYGTVAQYDPPLRTSFDQMAVLDALCDGTIDAIVSDHAPFPHPITGCENASCETAFALSYLALVRSERMSLADLCRLFCEHPRAILSLPPQKPIATGQSANFSLLSTKETVLQSHHFRTSSSHSPFLGQSLPYMVGAMVKNGTVTALLSDAIIRT